MAPPSCVFVWLCGYVCMREREREGWRKRKIGRKIVVVSVSVQSINFQFYFVLCGLPLDCPLFYNLPFMTLAALINTLLGMDMTENSGQCTQVSVDCVKHLYL